MNKLTSLVASSLALITLASGCAVEAPSPEEIASSEEAICYNREGVNAVLAGLVTSMGKELRRWQPMTDLKMVDGVLQLTQAGKDRCIADGKVCRNTQTMLDMQKWEAHQKVVFPDGSKLDVGVLRSRIATFYNNQAVCESRPDNHRGDNCPVEAHDLKYVGASMGTCGLDFKFHAYKAGTTQPLQYPAQLKNKLLFAGGSQNPLLAFNVVGDDVTVDPTGGLVEDNITTSGSCSAVCTKFSLTSLTGGCCSCNGMTKTYSRSPFSSFAYVCGQ